MTEGGAKTAPSWLSSLAVKFKDGRVKRVAFGHARADDEPGIPARFGVTSFPALVAVVPSPDGAYAVPFAKALPAKPAAALREVKEWLDGVVAGDAPEASRAAAPSFPAPDVPRKQADVSLAPLSEDNLHSACFGGRKSMCVLALVRAPGGEFVEVPALGELAKKYRNGARARRATRHALRCVHRAADARSADPFSFVWLDAPSQPEFAAALLGGADAAKRTPAVAVVKHGKRPRVAVYSGPLALADVSVFLDRILGGDAQFTPLRELPDLLSDAMRAALEAEDAPQAHTEL